MSAGDAELVRRAVAAFERGDATAFADCFDPEAELRLPRNLLEGGSYYGHAGIRRAVADAYETWGGFDFRVEGIDAAGTGLVVRARVTNMPRGGGPPVDYLATYAVRVGEAGIEYWSPHESPESAREALSGTG